MARFRGIFKYLRVLLARRISSLSFRYSFLKYCRYFLYQFTIELISFSRLPDDVQNTFYTFRPHMWTLNLMEIRAIKIRTYLYEILWKKKNKRRRTKFRIPSEGGFFSLARKNPYLGFKPCGKIWKVCTENELYLYLFSIANNVRVDLSNEALFYSIAIILVNSILYFFLFFYRSIRSLSKFHQYCWNNRFHYKLKNHQEVN